MEEHARRRKEILERNIAPWALQGYRVQFQGDRMVQLLKPQSRSGCLMVLPPAGVLAGSDHLLHGCP